MKQLKSKDPKAKETPCPYLFLEREEIPRHEHWVSMIEQMQTKMKEAKDFLELNQYIPVLLLIQKTFYHIPA
jgi:hypothetical protein